MTSNEAHLETLERELRPYAFDLAMSLIALEDSLTRRRVNDMTPSPSPLTIAEVVTPEHGETFAEEWYEGSIGTEEMGEAFTRTGVVTWPDDDPDAQGRFLAIEKKISEQVLGELRTAAAEAFVRIAGEVLAREREKG